MKKVIALLLLAAFVCAGASAQTTKAPKKTKANVTGFIKDSEQADAIERAAIQIMQLDTTTMVAGGVSNSLGGYTIKAVEEGSYIVKITYMGYHPFYRKITIKNGETIHNVGTTMLVPNTILLDAAVVTAKLPQMEVKEDTLIFNADAFKLPAGSVVEDLLKELPGVQVDDNGGITINGKKVQEILVNGKRFFSGGNNAEMAKQLNAEIVDKIKTYDRVSDNERLTGIADGQEQTVIDLTLKKGMDKGWQGNIRASGGNSKVYNGSLSLNRFTDVMNASVRGNYRTDYTNGVSRSGDAGANIVFQEQDKYEYGGNVNYRGSKSDRNSRSASQNFRNTIPSFTDQMSSNMNHSDSYGLAGRFEFKIDSMTTVNIEPSYNKSNSGSGNDRTSKQFRNNDPYSYEGIDNPNYEKYGSSIIPVEDWVNSQLSAGNNKSDGENGSIRMLLARRFKTRNRSFSLNMNGSFNSNDRYNYSTSNITYYQPSPRTNIVYRRGVTPSDSYNLGASISYSEPIAQNLMLQLTYDYSRNYSKSDNKNYDLGHQYLNWDKSKYPTFDEFKTYLITERPEIYSAIIRLSGMWGRDLLDELEVRGTVQIVNPDLLDQALAAEDQKELRQLIGYLPDDYEAWRSDSLSQYNTSLTSNHDIRLQIRWNSNFITSSVGAEYQPVYQHIKRNYMGRYIDKTRTYAHISPFLQFRYRFNRQNQLNFRYNARIGEPDITQLLDYTDTSNPLHISTGNPDLKASFTNSFSFDWQNYITATMQNINIRLSYSNTLNRTANKTFYDDNTGVSKSMPVNVNGNWDASANVGFQTPLFAIERLELNINGGINFDNSVGMREMKSETIFGATESKKSITKTLRPNARVTLRYRGNNWSVQANGNFNYTHTENNLVEPSNPNTYTFSYGVRGTANLDNGLGFNTDLNMSSRRGLKQKDANRDELIWGAQVSYRFLRRTVQAIFRADDILNSRKNIGYSAGSESSSVTWTNTISRRFTLTLIYNFRLYGDREARRQLKAERAEREAAREQYERNNQLDGGRNGGGNLNGFGGGMGGFGGGMGGFGGGFGGGRF